ncbi:MAG: helix-turn-helix domain-containing protein [Burkholderiales bacterium]|nr:helix-turn-helix domain-containing protein [Burkholderiales bacterium]
MNLQAMPALQVRHSTSTHIEAHTDELLDWDLRYDQLDCGRFEGRFTDIRCEGLQIFQETTTRRVRQRGHLPPGSFSMGTMLAGEGSLHVNGRSVAHDTLIAVQGQELDLCTPPHCTLAGMVVDTSLLHNAAAGRPDLGTLLHGQTLQAVMAPAPTLVALRALLQAALALAQRQPEALQAPGVQRHLRDELLWHAVQALSSAGPATEPQRGHSRKQLVDRACELMLAPTEVPPTLIEVCARLGVSPRKLLYCFKDVLGQNPATYIKAVRLNGVRRDLASLHATVLDVAARWGFWHFSHFSADYKRLFGELPSETLRRQRGSSAVTLRH